MVIADDEPAVRQYLRYIVEQYNLPFQICGEAEDGEQAVRLADEHQPEFLILDINMPLLSGLEAAKLIREKHKHAMIYILTAYSQFEYAQQAVQTQVADYLLKPIKPAQLVETLRKGIAGALSLRMTDQRLRRLERQVAKDKPLVTQQRLFELLKTSGENTQALKLLRSVAKQKEFVPAAILSASYWYCGGDFAPAGVEEQLCQEASALWQQQAIITAFSDELVIIFDRWDYELRGMVQNLLEAWEGKYGLTFCAGLSLVASPEHIGRDYNNARKKREAGLFWRQQGLMIVDQAVDGLQEIDCEPVQKQLQECLLERKTDKAKTIFRQFLHDAQQRVYQPEYVHAAIVKMANDLVGKYAEYVISDAEANTFRRNFIAQVNQTTSVCDLEQCLCSLLDLLEGTLASQEQNQAEQAVKWAIEYINTNYHKDLTLEHLAEKLFISTGYFCRIFKKYAGEGYAAYLTNIRLKKAKEILLTGKYNVNEAARMVGFRDASYFSSVFKKHYRQSPSNLVTTIRSSS